MSALPHDLDAETAVLDSLLLRPEQIGDVGKILRPEDFYSFAKRRIYSVIVDLAVSGEPVDYVTVHAELRRRGDDGAEVAAELIALRTPLSTRATTYASIVKDLAERRRLMVALDEAMDRLERGEDLDVVAGTIGTAAIRVMERDQ